MIIKEREWNTCSCCGSRKLKSEEVYGCDECRKEIDLNQPDRAHLEAAVFHHGSESKHLHFCSWRCVIKGLRKVKTDHFISLPFLLYDEAGKGLRARDFFALLK